MSLTSAYAKAWQDQYGLPPGWFVNTQPNDEIPLGLKGRLDDDTFQRTSLLTKLSGLVPTSPGPNDDSEWQFQSSSSIESSAAIEGKTGQSIAWLAGAKAGVKASFGRSAGVSAYGANKWFDRFPDLDVVKTILRGAVADGSLVEGDAVVVERQLTGKGLMLVSQGGEASIEALADASVAPHGVKIADFSAGLTVTKQNGAVALEKFGDGSVIAARVMHVGHRGMWWWRELVVVGITEITPAEQEAA